MNLAHGVDWIKINATERAGTPDTDPRKQMWSEAEMRAIVEEAGGVVQDQNGISLKYNKEDLHNPAFFVFAQTEEESVARIKHAIKQSC